MLFGAAVMRKSVFEKVGFFDETLHHNEDTDWFMRVREMGVSMAIIQEVSLFYRRHNSNMSLNVAIRDSYFIRALKKSLDRRRQEGDGSVVPIPKLVDLERVTRNSQETTNCIEIEREQRKEP
jgi:GT2 family glycosyltransferase